MRLLSITCNYYGVATSPHINHIRQMRLLLITCNYYGVATPPHINHIHQMQLLSNTKRLTDSVNLVKGLCGPFKGTIRSVSQCAAMCCSVLQITETLCCSVLQHTATLCCSSVLQHTATLWCDYYYSNATTMGWLRLVGSIESQVSFAEYCLCYRALLQKRPIILSILLTKATPYQSHTSNATTVNHKTPTWLCRSCPRPFWGVGNWSGACVRT